MRVYVLRMYAHRRRTAKGVHAITVIFWYVQILNTDHYVYVYIYICIYMYIHGSLWVYAEDVVQICFCKIISIYAVKKTKRTKKNILSPHSKTQSQGTPILQRTEIPPAKLHCHSHNIWVARNGFGFHTYIPLAALDVFFSSRRHETDHKEILSSDWIARSKTTQWMDRGSADQRWREGKKIGSWQRVYVTERIFVYCSMIYSNRMAHLHVYIRTGIVHACSISQMSLRNNK